MPISHETILRQVKHRSRASKPVNLIRVVEVDDWAWRKGHVSGTILVDLDAGRVVDVLPDRSSQSVANWLGRHPEVEIVSRDRHGLYAEGAQQGAPQARQVADRVHLLDNLRERLEKQLKPSPAVLSLSVVAIRDAALRWLLMVRGRTMVVRRALHAGSWPRQGQHRHRAPFDFAQSA